MSSTFHVDNGDQYTFTFGFEELPNGRMVFADQFGLYTPSGDSVITLLKHDLGYLNRLMWGEYSQTLYIYFNKYLYGIKEGESGWTIFKIQDIRENEDDRNNNVAIRERAGELLLFRTNDVVAYDLKEFKEMYRHPMVVETRSVVNCDSSMYLAGQNGMYRVSVSADGADLLEMDTCRVGRILTGGDPNEVIYATSCGVKRLANDRVTEADSSGLHDILAKRIGLAGWLSKDLLGACSMDQGMTLYDLKNNTSYKLQSGAGLNANSAMTFFVDSRERIWISNVQDIQMFDLKDGLSYFGVEQGYSSSLALSKPVAKDSVMYCFQVGGTFRVLFDEGKFKSFEQKGKKTAECNGGRVEGQEVKLSYASGLFVHDGNDLVQVNEEGAHDMGSEGRRDTYSDQSGMGVFENDKKKLLVYSPDGFVTDNFTYNPVTNRFWASEYGGGLYGAKVEEGVVASFDSLPFENGGDAAKVDYFFEYEQQDYAVIGKDVWKFAEAENKFKSVDLPWGNAVSATVGDDGGVVLVDKNYRLRRLGPKVDTISTFVFDKRIKFACLADSDLVVAAGHDKLYLQDLNRTRPSGFEPALKSFVAVSFVGQETSEKFMTNYPLNEREVDFEMHDVHFWFDNNDYTQYHLIDYSYQLAGYDDDWSDWSSQASKEYTNLFEGEYVFKVKCRNSLGNYGPVTEVRFEILPPWYRTLWAYSLWVLLGIGFVVLVSVLNNRRHIRASIKLKRIINEKTADLRKKNTQINDSISYAQRIQEAILPSRERMKNFFSDMFVYYAPKDIVSGDFYWFHSAGKKAVVTVADCTGHGVPGAFMSIVGHSLLEKIVKQDKITESSKILEQLSREVEKTLNRKKEKRVKDGMDLVLATIDLEEMKMSVSGAYNILYLIRNGELTQYKGDSLSIGDVAALSEKQYAQNELAIQSGDIIYLSTDGFPDQKGGERKKKYYYGPFRDLLEEIHTLPMEEQKEILRERFMSWKGDIEQIDDVCVMGIKI